MSNELKLSSPWQTYVNELMAMFKDDPEVTIKFDDESKIVKIYAAKSSKASALETLLKHEVTFGKVTLKVEVVPPNTDTIDILEAFDDAFSGNPAMSYTFPIESPIGTFRYVVFKNEVVQFFNDQLDDINGNRSTLYQNIAKDIFDEHLSVNYCTDVKDKKLAKPLGEWP